MNAEFFALAFTAALNPKLLALDLLLIENRRPRAMFLCVLLVSRVPLVWMVFRTRCSGRAYWRSRSMAQRKKIQPHHRRLTALPGDHRLRCPRVGVVAVLQRRVRADHSLAGNAVRLLGDRADEVASAARADVGREAAGLEQGVGMIHPVHR